MKNISHLSKINTLSLGKNFTVLSSVDSTNTFLKNNHPALSHGHLVIADEQLCGRGRSGKSFHSPKAQGLYMSLLIKNPDYVKQKLFTVKTSIAVCRAIDRITGTTNSNGVGIKWVNDIYFGDKKLSGILCERVTTTQSESPVIIGIGINLHIEKSSLPKDLKGIVCSLYDLTKTEYDKYILCGIICEELEKVFENSNDESAIDEYKKRSVVIGREIGVVIDGKPLRAAALDICEDGCLLVRTEDGFTRKLSSGEVSIRLKK